MQLTLREGLILIPVTVTYGDTEIHVPDVVSDTGSGTTMLSIDNVFDIHGILGMDLLLHTGSSLNLNTLQLDFAL